MASKTLFQSLRGMLHPRSDAINEAGGQAYALTDRQALAQYAATGCLSDTYYATQQDQLERVLELAKDLPPDFVARVAVYSRERGFMKDMPALLLAILAAGGHDELVTVFDRVVDNGRMLRNFVQILRSGVVGRKSLGTRPRRLVRQWLDSRSDRDLFFDSVGQSPSLVDIVRMVHPRPKSASRSALFAWMLGKPYVEWDLPDVVRQYLRFQSGDSEVVPDAPFQMLTNLPLVAAEWSEIARRAKWHMTRMNLNTFLRQGVLEDPVMRRLIAARLRDPEAIRSAKVFPYQIMTAFLNANDAMPRTITNALQDAMEIATANVPRFRGRVYVCPDVSGSMHSSVTGHRPGATSRVRCVDVAALVAASILRVNDAQVIPFTDRVEPVRLNARDTVMTNAQVLASVPPGATACSAPLRELNRRRARGDLVILVSDNESWMDSSNWGYTQTLEAWRSYKRRNPKARLVCIDIQPYSTVQTPPSHDILHVGGFSDRVFDVIANFAESSRGSDHWVSEIESITL